MLNPLPFHYRDGLGMGRESVLSRGAVTRSLISCVMLITPKNFKKLKNENFEKFAPWAHDFRNLCQVFEELMDARDL